MVNLSKSTSPGCPPQSRQLVMLSEFSLQREMVGGDNLIVLRDAKPR